MILHTNSAAPIIHNAQPHPRHHAHRHLTLDIPATPLFKDSQGGNIIPQIPLFKVLDKYNGENWTVSLGWAGLGFRGQHRCLGFANR